MQKLIYIPFLLFIFLVVACETTSQKKSTNSPLRITFESLIDISKNGWYQLAYAKPLTLNEGDSVIVKLNSKDAYLRFGLASEISNKHTHHEQLEQHIYIYPNNKTGGNVMLDTRNIARTLNYYKIGDVVEIVLQNGNLDYRLNGESFHKQQLVCKAECKLSPYYSVLDRTYQPEMYVKKRHIL